MSYHRTKAPPDNDPLRRQHSPYETVPRAQPTTTTCLVASFQTAAESVGAAASYLPEDLLSIVSDAVGPRGWSPSALADAIQRHVAYMTIRAVRGPNLVANHDAAYVLLIPALEVGHAVAVIREHPGAIWDPWPPGTGTVRQLSSHEYARWKQLGFPAIEVRLTP